MAVPVVNSWYSFHFGVDFSRKHSKSIFYKGLEIVLRWWQSEARNFRITKWFDKG